MTSPLILDSESLKALRPPVMPISQMASTNPIGGMPAPVMPSVTAAPNPLTQRLQTDQGELKRLQDTGSGVSQISNPFLRGLARVGDVAASIVSPGAASIIPGTTLHNRLLQRQAVGRIGEDQGEQQKQANNDYLGAEAAQKSALAAQEQAKALALVNPKPTDGQLLYDGNKNPIGFHDGTGKFFGPDDPSLDPGVRDVLHAAQKKQPTTAFELWQQQNPKGTAEQFLAMSKPEKDANMQQQYLDALQSRDTQKAQAILKVIQDTKTAPTIQIHEATARPESGGTWQMVIDKDNNPKFFNTKTGEVKDNTAGIQKPKGDRANTDEQKRADMAHNLNENLDSMEDILNRRPELFGPMAGRMTDLKAGLGTDDVDIAKMINIRHQLGMVAQSTHGMRSAQGVEAAATGLLNGFHNSPTATRAALESARTSAKTFLGDANNPGQSRGSGSSPQSSGAVTVTAPDNSIHTFPNQASADKFKQLAGIK